MPSYRSLRRLRRCAPLLLLTLSPLLTACAVRGALGEAVGVEAVPAPTNLSHDAVGPGSEVAGAEAEHTVAPGGMSGDDVWSRPTDEDPATLPDDVIRIDQLSAPLPDACDWNWRWAPTGLIYHSYMAGVHEPRMALFAFSDLDGRSLWDATLGGRAGIVQYGDGDPIQPVGYQLDFYGAAVARLDVENQQDLDATDYVFGFPLTFGDAQWQWKFGYAHLSSHLGDEFAIRNPGALAGRINYVRDALVLGTSYYLVPSWRVYGETGFAFHTSGGARPIDLQFGTEVANPIATGCWTPYVAVNGRMREECDFGGDFTLQAGWLQRGMLGQSFRLGGQFYTGKSSQFQFYTRSEQQLGIGVWYDF